MTYFHHYHNSYQNVYFLLRHVLLTALSIFLSHAVSINFFFLALFLFFFLRLLLINPISQSLEPWIFHHHLVSEFLILVHFRMLRIPITVNKLKHMTCYGPHGSRITTWGTFLMEFFFSASNEVSPVLVIRVI